MNNKPFDITQLPERNTPEDVQRNLDRLFGVIPPQEDEPPSLPVRVEYKSPARTMPPESGDVLAELPISQLDDFPAELHRWRAYSDDELAALVESIRTHGILQPLIVRRKGDRYEIISGHNRRTGARLLGYRVVPCVIRREVSDDEAIMQMNSCNLHQREKPLHSEKAFAYRDLLEAMKRQGIRTDLTSAQVGTKLADSTLLQAATRLDSAVEIGKAQGESRDTVFRYIRLTYLIPELLKLVDTGKLPFVVGVTLSYISTEGQRLVVEFFYEQRSISITQDMADTLRELDRVGELTAQLLADTFLSPPVTKIGKVSVSLKKWSKYFKPDATRKEIQDVIDKALQQYFQQTK